MKYERVDFSDLLKELQGKKDPVQNEHIQDEPIQNEQDNPENKLNTGIPQGYKEIPQKNVKKYSKAMGAVQQLLLHGRTRNIDYAEYINDIIEMLTIVENTDCRYCNTLRHRLKSPTTDDIQRMKSWLSDLKDSISRESEEKLQFYSLRLIEKSNFCICYDHFIKTNSLDKKDIESIFEVDKSKENILLHKARSNDQIKYICNIKEKVIHDKSCNFVKEMTDDEFEALADWSEDYKACPVCRRKAYVRAGAKDIKEYGQYDKLFKLMGANDATIKQMYMEYKFVTKISNMLTEGYKYSSLKNNAITIWHGEDAWRIGITDKNRVRLEHNNYRLKKGGKREFVSGFHIQNEYSTSTSLNIALNQIVNYNFEAHFKNNEHIKKTNAEYEKSIQEINSQYENIINAPQNKQSWWEKIKNKIIDKLCKKRLEADRINALKNAWTDSKPMAGTQCLYLWIDEDGNCKWGTGWYLKSSKKFFSRDFHGTIFEVKYENVIKWVALEDIDIM